MLIKINLNSYDDLVDKYNNDLVSKDLINYIIDKVRFVGKKDKIELEINKSFETDIDIVSFIKKSINDEYLLILKKSYINNIKQIMFLVLGIIFLGLSSFINNSIFHEIVIIGAWVLIWEMIDLQLFSDSELRRNKYILKRIMNAEFRQK